MMSNSHDFNVEIETVDFGRRKLMYVRVDGDKWISPDDGTFIVGLERKPFMEWAPAILNANDLFGTIYDAVHTDALQDAVVVGNETLLQAFARGIIQDSGGVRVIH